MQFSKLTVVSVISVVMGFAVVITSATYLDGVRRLTRKGGHELLCVVNSKGPILFPGYCETTKDWETTGSLGVAVGIFQIGLATIGLKLINAHVHIVWYGSQFLVFLAVMILFSLGKKVGVDENIFELAIGGLFGQLGGALLCEGNECKTSSKGQALLAFAGLDFLYMLASTIFVYYVTK